MLQLSDDSADKIGPRFVFTCVHFMININDSLQYRFREKTKK